MLSGNLICSMLIIWRFIGMAIVTPSTAMKNIQAKVTPSGMCCPVSRSRAATAEVSVPPVE